MQWHARFVKSARALADCPRWNAREIAFAGRSNAGKSSLINALTGVRGLARVSKTPGCTQNLNFFALNDDLALVDFPGHGYARMSQAAATRIASMIEEYLALREGLALLVMIVDARRGPNDEDLALARMSAERGIGVLVAASKIDKLKRAQRGDTAHRFQAISTRVIPCSAIDGEGIVTLRRAIAAVTAA